MYIVSLLYEEYSTRNIKMVNLNLETMNAEIEQYNRDLTEIKALIDKETNSTIKRALHVLYSQVLDELLESVI